MHKFALAAALATLAIGAALSAAQAESHYGPTKRGDQCWHHQTGSSLGYWGSCERSRAAENSKTRSKTGRNNPASQPSGQSGGQSE